MTIARREAVEPTPTQSRAVITVLLLGAGLRLWQYAAAPSFYIGEIALARNVTDRTIAHLLTERPAFGQAASEGYLAVQKLFVTVLGDTEQGHRLFPLICSLAALILFYRVARQFLSGIALVFALTAFSLGIPFLLILAQFKPHGTVDTAASLAIWLVALDLWHRPLDTRTLIRAGAIGFLLLWFSEDAFMVAIGAGVALCGSAAIERDWPRWRALAASILPWFVAGTLASVVAYRTTDPSTRQSLHDLYAGGAFPLPPHLAAEATWLWTTAVFAVRNQLLHYPLPVVVIAAAAVGAVVLARRHRDAFWILALPAITAVAASAAGFFIMHGVYVTFLLPLAIILVAAGADWAGDRLANVAPPVRTVWMASWFAFPIVAIVQRHPVYRIEETTPMLRHLQASRQPGDAIYTFFGARQAMTYYGPRFGIAMGDVAFGECHRDDPRRYLVELDRFRGRPRVWILIAHDVEPEHARETILDYLDHIGTARDSLVVARSSLSPFVTGAYLYLYDLSDPARLAATAALTTQLRYGDHPDHPLPCGNGPVSLESP